MELTIHVPDEIRAQAEASGLAPEVYAQQLVSKGLFQAKPRELAAMRAAAERIREFRQTHTLNGLTMKEHTDEGRKY